MSENACYFDRAPDMWREQRKSLRHHVVAEAIAFMAKNPKEGGPVTAAFKRGEANVDNTLGYCPFRSEPALGEIVGVQPLTGDDALLDFGVDLHGVTWIHRRKPLEVHFGLLWIEPAINVKELASRTCDVLGKDCRGRSSYELATIVQDPRPHVR
jgi:hypothetical protein